MFTGIVQSIGEIAGARTNACGQQLLVAAGKVLDRACIGDSIAVNGVCLTVTGINGEQFSADVSNETLSLTNLGQLNQGSRVNLEAALRVGDAFGGHFVSGHVDSMGKVSAIAADGASQRVSFEIPAELSRYVAPKGSITIDGVSLTVNTVQDTIFAINLIPHTLQATTLGDLRVGQSVNLEVDLLARYLERINAVEAQP